MFAFFTKHTLLSRMIVGVILSTILAGPLVTPLSVSAQTPSKPEIVGVDKNAPPPPEFGCMEVRFGVVPWFNFKNCFAALVWGGMLIVGSIMTTTALLLNYTMQKLVVEMGSFVNSVGAITVVWQTVRDLVNVFLVFLTIFIGIATILGISGYGYKQLLWKVVLASLLVNFSITLTKFVIDMGNILAVATYQELLTYNSSDGRGGVDPNLCVGDAGDPDSLCLNLGLSAVFLQQMKLTTIYSVGTLPSGDDEDPWLRRIVFIGIFGSIFFLVVAFIFATAAFLMMGRFAILILLIMFSPVGLVAWITGVSGWGKKWWKMLLDQTFFLPIMLIFWYATANVMGGMNGLLSNDTLATALGTPGDPSRAGNPAEYGGLMGVFVYFFLISAMMIISIVVARNLGAYGASRAMGAGKMLAGMGLAYTAGAVSNLAAERYRDRVARSQQRDEQGNYLDSGRGSRFYRKIAGGRIDRAAQKTLGAGANAKFMGAKSFTDRRNATQAAEQARNQELAGATIRTQAQLHANTILQGAGGGAVPATPEKLAYAREQLGKLDKDNLLQLARANPHLINDPHYRDLFTASQVSTLEQSGLVAPQVTQSMANNATMRARRQSIRNERQLAAVPAHVTALAGGATGAARDAAVQGISGLDKNDLLRTEQTNPAQFSNPHFASALSKAQMTNLEQSTDHNPATLTAVYAQRGTVLMRHIATGDANAARRLVRNMSEAEQRQVFTQINNSIAGMPAGELRTLTEVLSGPLITNLTPGSFMMGGAANPNIARELTGDQLKALDAAGNLGETAKHELYKAIVDTTSGTARPHAGTQRTAFNWLTRDGSAGIEWKP